MKFELNTLVPKTSDEVWAVLVDIERVTTCLPGCHNVVEVARLDSYTAELRQQIGPFKLVVPATIQVEDVVEAQSLVARARGRDKMTGTQIDVHLHLALQGQDGGQTRLEVRSEVSVAGRLASLGYGAIKKKTDENFAEFERRLLAELGQAPAADVVGASGEAGASAEATSGAAEAPAPGVGSKLTRWWSSVRAGGEPAPGQADKN